MTPQFFPFQQSTEQLVITHTHSPPPPPHTHKHPHLPTHTQNTHIYKQTLRLISYNTYFRTVHISVQYIFPYSTYFRTVNISVQYIFPYSTYFRTEYCLHTFSKHQLRLVFTFAFNDPFNKRFSSRHSDLSIGPRKQNINFLSAIYADVC